MPIAARSKYALIKVTKFAGQETWTFHNGAPQRETYVSEEGYEDACAKYAKEWVQIYECLGKDCPIRACPQHSNV